MSGIYALGSFSHGGGAVWPGIVRDGRVLPLRLALPEAPSDLSEIVGHWNDWSTLIEAAAAEPDGWLDEAALTVHLPYLPENLFGAGANYHRHVVDLIIAKGAGGTEDLSLTERRASAEAMMRRRAATGMPYVFIASRSAVAGAYDPLILPELCQEPDWELELAVVIGKPARRVSRAEALDYVAGYTIANDITARDLVERPDVPQIGMDWLSSKNAPGFKILGPYITPARFVPNPQALHIRLLLNGDVMQDESTNDMIFDVACLIEYVSYRCQLNPGDIIMTGSPAGNGAHYGRFLRQGDVMECEIDGLVGMQRTPCVAENSRAPLARCGLRP